MKLKFYMEQIENTVVFRIIEQDFELDKCFYSSNGFSIEQADFPMLGHGSAIYLRGEFDNKDWITSCKVFTYAHGAIKYKDRYIAALCELFEKNIPEPEVILKRGDRVLVSDNYIDADDCTTTEHSRIYLTTIEGSESPYIVVDGSYSSAYLNNEPFKISEWENMRLEQNSKEVLTKHEGNIYTLEV